MFSHIFERKHLFVAMTDDDTKKRDIRIIKFGELNKYNDMKYGIFFTTQTFKGERRVVDELETIVCWHVDMDKDSKEKQKALIANAPLFPSAIVETKRGYHCYFMAKDATVLNFPIIEQRLIQYFNGDNNAKDLARIMRLPLFYHWKDLNNPFLVNLVHDTEKTYSEALMLRSFPEVKQFFKPRPVYTGVKSDCMKGLEVLSGLSCVNGDRFTFRRNANGTYQIWSNGKSTSCWIDHNGTIGSHDNAGPSLLRWLQWYGYDFNSAKSILQEKGLWNVEP